MMKRLLFKICMAVPLALLCAQWAQANVTLNETNFPDANFRAALSAITGVSVGSSFNVATLTELDVSNKGITNIKGVELLTALTKLIASHNDIKFANITNNPHLEWLDLSYNPALRGFNSTSGSGTTSTHWITLTNNMPLKHLDLSNCNIGYFQALSTGYHVNSLTWLSLANNPAMAGWSPGISNQTDLVYCDLTNTAQTSASVAFSSAHNKLETLILKNNSNFGYSSSFQYLSALKYLDISNCDIFFREGGGTEDYYLLHYLTPTNNPNLETLLASNSKLGPQTEGLTGFTNLKTVDVSNNVTSGTVNMTQFWVNGSPNLESLDIRGNSALTYLQLNNDDLPRNNFTLLVDDNCTALNSLYLNDNNYSSVDQATSDFSGLSHLAFLYLEHNSGFTGGPLTMTAADCGSLTGIDLSNNGFTSFLAESLPSSLTALMIGKNPGMKRLEMHNNPGITKMSADTVMSDGSGLYLLGNTALTYMDISGNAEQPNYFERIGNNGSLEDVPIDTIKASYNKFYTFRNLEAVPGNIYEYWGEKYIENGQEKAKNVYHMSSNGNLESTYRYKSYWPTMPAMPDSASLEQLPNLRYLDLSHCNLKDSVYLHKNTDLRYLDVSHNRKIARSFTTQNKGAGYRAHIASGKPSSSYPDYKKYLWLASNTNDREPYTNDCNDTTGLYILDLIDNNLLEYLDISYTGIEQTAMTHCHVANARYIWIQDLPELKYFYSDYNGMRSMGIGTLYGKKRASAYASTAGLKSLERLSSIGMRGTDKTTMQGSINFRENTVCTKLHYINLAYSRYDSVGVYIPTVDTLILRGNPIHYVNAQKINDITYLDLRECAFKMRGYDAETGDIFFPNVNDYKNGARIGGVYYTSSTNIPASNPKNNGDLTTAFSGLRGVRAYKRPKLTTVLLDNSNALREVYCFEDSVLPKIYGFENLAYNLPWDGDYNLPTQDADSLMIVKVNDNPEFIDLKLHKNDTLLYLYAYNDRKLGPALGENGMNLTNNKYLRTAWVSNSLLERFVNDAKEHLDTLYIWQNPQLAELDVTKNTQLRHFDLHNCMINELDVSKNTQLVKFDCSNQDSIWVNTFYDHYNYRMPAAVPTSMTQPGRNSIADLHFSSHSLKIVHADKNDLYCMTGLSQNPNLDTLTYSYNHINAIDLSGCSSLPANADLTHYDCRHNVRGIIPGELAAWYTQDEGSTTKTKHELYYFQLDDNAGDELPSMPNSYNTFLGSKEGQDSLRIVNGIYNPRELTADGFDPTKVEIFDVNSSGPHDGQRTNADNGASGAPMRATEIIDPSDQLDLSTIYGKIVVLKYMNKDRNYVEYLYRDGRTSGNRAEGLSRFGLVWYAPDTPTDVEETLADGFSATVVSERYYDTAGVEHSQPVKGVNIVVRQMSDGSTQTVKILK